MFFIKRNCSRPFVCKFTFNLKAFQTIVYFSRAFFHFFIFLVSKINK